jgi:hypothetical protein
VKFAGSEAVEASVESLTAREKQRLAKFVADSGI